jgi:hypothetical protein
VCLIRDSSDDDTEDCEDDIAAADSALDEERNEGEEEGHVHCNSGFIWEGIDNYHGQRELFSGHSGPQNLQ